VFANHVDIALGSHAEFETCLEIARRLGFVAAHDKGKLFEGCNSVGRLLNGLYESRERKLLTES
jgi:four helix bundle protein